MTIVPIINEFKLPRANRMALPLAPALALALALAATAAAVDDTT
eukprot:COSAG06_NODE_47031_length_342_cov_1.032922_1_plen_43_part_01